MLFKKINISGWRQFNNVDISFHDRLTVLTGANGSGKTTILNLLSSHFGWGINFVSTFSSHKDKGGIFKYFSDIGDKIRGLLFGSKDSEPLPKEQTIGSIEYSDGKSAKLTVPLNVASTYNVSISPQRPIKGLHLPSHRSIYTYRNVSNIPIKAIARQDAFNNYSNTLKAQYLGSGYDTNRPQSYYLKETLISLAVLGYGNEAVTPNIEAKQTFEEFQKILTKVLPPKLGFRKIEIRLPEVILITDSGDFSLDAISGGVAAIIDLAWQIFLYDPKPESFVVTIDEPENHLHPEMQRRLLPDFLSAFPNVQFIIATHNPIILSSVKESNVYVLTYNEEPKSKVVSSYLDMVNKAGSANDILREVLGIEVTMPIWAEKQLQDIITKYLSLEINNTNLDLLREELNKIGFGKFVPKTIANVVAQKKL